MNIYEFADVIGKNIEIIRFANQKGRTIARFERSEIKKNSMLYSEYGEGKTVNEAMKNYVDKIKGKTIVFNSMSDDRIEYNVPDNLTCEV